MRRVALVLVALSGCGTDDRAAVRGAALEVESPVDACRTLFAREYECRAEFIPALVDLRIKLDLPAGIAARARSEGRSAIYKVAHEEYLVDGSEPRRTETCKQMAPRTPLAMFREAKTCLARSGCAEFVACMMPIHEARFRARR